MLWNAAVTALMWSWDAIHFNFFDFMSIFHSRIMWSLKEFQQVSIVVMVNLFLSKYLWNNITTFTLRSYIKASTLLFKRRCDEVRPEKYIKILKNICNVWDKSNKKRNKPVIKYEYIQPNLFTFPIVSNTLHLAISLSVSPPPLWIRDLYHFSFWEMTKNNSKCLLIGLIVLNDRLQRVTAIPNEKCINIPSHKAL